MDEIEQMAARLQRVRHFTNMPIDDILTIIKSGSFINYQKYKVIFEEGEISAGLYVIIMGVVNLTKLNSEGKVGILNTLEAVTMFNEVAALDGEGNPVTAIAHTNVRLWHLETEKFQQLVREHPQLGISLLGILARRNRLMISHYGDLSFRSVQSRMAKYILALSENGTVVIDRRQNSIGLIAAHIITTPEAVSRTLRAIKSIGIISASRTEIKVLKLRDLQEMAERDF